MSKPIKLVSLSSDEIPLIRIGEVSSVNFSVGFLVVYDDEVVLYPTFGEAIADAIKRRQHELDVIRAEQIEDARQTGGVKMNYPVDKE